MDRKGPALPKINVVAIEREDFLLRESSFQNDCHRRFFQFSTQRAIRSQKVILDELLRECRAALNEFTLIEISSQGSKDSPPIDSVVAEEAAVLDCQNCIPQGFREVRKLNGNLLAAIAFAHGRQQLTLD